MITRRQHDPARIDPQLQCPVSVKIVEHGRQEVVEHFRPDTIADEVQVNGLGGDHLRFTRRSFPPTLYAR